MNKTNIEWCDFTFNPVVGCKHGCKYCYAKQISNRFKMVQFWERPEFFPERLHSKIPKIPKIRNRIAEIISPDKPLIFVGSMCDLFGEWVNPTWIIETMDYTHFKEANFMFLTKNPKNYFGYNLRTQNTIIGTTIESKKQLNRLEEIKKFNNKKFISIEPIMSDFSGVDFSGIDFIIVGAMTGKNPIKPKKEWIESINHNQIYYKLNVLRYYPELDLHSA
jgi:protein gp37